MSSGIVTIFQKMLNILLRFFRKLIYAFINAPYRTDKWVIRFFHGGGNGILNISRQNKRAGEFNPGSRSLFFELFCNAFYGRINFYVFAYFCSVCGRRFTLHSGFNGRCNLLGEILALSTTITSCGGLSGVM